RYMQATALSAVLTGAAAAAIAATLSMTLPGADAPIRESKTGLPSGQAWRALLRPNVRSLIGPLVLGFIGISIFYAFYSLYLEELGIGKEWIGIISNIGVGAEVTLMLFSAPLLAKFGLRGVMIVGAACLVVRMALLAAVPSPTVAIVSQLLHGPIVLWLYLVPPMYLNLQAEPSYRNSMQSLYSVLCFGVARWVGSIVGGHATQLGGDPMTGLRWAFLLALVLAVIALTWLVIFFRDDKACQAIRDNADQGRGAAAAADSKPDRLV
ncbi:MAG: MFS transporter, partial [Phycisphaeraceae bacterium]